MPSRASAVGGTACKIVSVPRSSADTDGLPATTFVLDEQSGKVVGVVNAAELTGVRTAAGSAVASRMLLEKGEERTKLVVFGAGVQAFWHTHLHLLLFPSLSTVSFLARPSSSPSDRLLSLIAKLQPLHPNVTFEHSSREGFDRGQAVHNADIIICCTPSQIPLFPPTQPRSGTHIVLIGSYKPFMLEVAPEMLSNRAGVVFVDGIEETKAEAGELQGYEGEVCEVGSVLGEENEGEEGRARWEKAGGELTIFKSVGLAVQDVSITRLVFDKAKELGLGVETEY
ncbi:hypothetical protein BDY24DRAFT_399533 [Mrakia frigida]|uniref:uncharacterized protein n=1 Tax=Mrakia frigida TaxID=29902 RepID=UPI003FCC125D